MAAHDSVLIAQLTDTHVLAGSSDLDNDERLAVAVDALCREIPQPDVVLLTGDLADEEIPSQYDRLVELLEPIEVPLLALPGNHDARDLIRDAFPATPWIDADHASWVTDVGGVRVVGLDSTRPGYHGGQVDADRVEWLRDVLAEPHDGVTVLAMHHPPFPSEIDWMDTYQFEGVAGFEDAVREAGCVDRIVCGHLHRPIGGSIGGVAVQVGVSTARHVALDLAPGAGPSLVDDPIGYQLHVVTARGVVTHTRYVGTGREPYVPDWADDF